MWEIHPQRHAGKVEHVNHKYGGRFCMEPHAVKPDISNGFVCYGTLPLINKLHGGAKTTQKPLHLNVKRHSRRRSVELPFGSFFIIVQLPTKDLFHSVLSFHYLKQSLDRM